MAIVIGQSALREEGERRGHSLTLRGTNEGLHTSVGTRVFVYRGGHPLIGTLLVDQLAATLDHADIFTTGNTFPSPPSAGYATIVYTYHCLHDIVHLVGNRLLTVSLCLRPESCIIAKFRTCQLVGISVVDIILNCRIPILRFSTIKCARTNNLSCKNRLGLHDCRHGIVVTGVSCVGFLEVWFVERCHAEDFVTTADNVISSKGYVVHIVLTLRRRPCRFTASVTLLVADVTDTRQKEHLFDTCLRYIVKFSINSGFHCIRQRTVCLGIS